MSPIHDRVLIKPLEEEKVGAVEATTARHA
jgi:hypothetical protein